MPTVPSQESECLKKCVTSGRARADRKSRLTFRRCSTIQNFHATWYLIRYCFLLRQVHGQHLSAGAGKVLFPAGFPLLFELPNPNRCQKNEYPGECQDQWSSIVPVQRIFSVQNLYSSDPYWPG